MMKKISKKAILEAGKKIKKKVTDTAKEAGDKAAKKGGKVLRTGKKAAAVEAENVKKATASTRKKAIAASKKAAKRVAKTTKAAGAKAAKVGGKVLRNAKKAAAAEAENVKKATAPTRKKAVAAGKKAAKRVAKTTKAAGAKVAKAGKKAGRTAKETGAQAASRLTKASKALLAWLKKFDKRKIFQVGKKVAVAKAGGSAAVAGVYTAATLFGTASTGTAIGTLSGAALHSATLAWLGGSVFTGGIIIVGVGIAGGLAVNYFVDRMAEASMHEILLQAIRKSYNDLADATPEQIAEYFRGWSKYTDAEKQGVVNLITGKFHELLFADKENKDGDGKTAELHKETNHPGSDVIITDTATGASEAVQLKATNSLDYLLEQLAKYPDIKIFVTEELAKLIADKIASIKSSGFSNEEMRDFVERFFDNLLG